MTDPQFAPSWEPFGIQILDGDDLVGVVVNVPFSDSVETVADLTGTEVGAARLTATGASVRGDTGWTLFLDDITPTTTAVDSEGVWWATDGATDADRKLIAFGPNPLGPSSPYEPTWDSGLIFLPFASVAQYVTEVQAGTNVTVDNTDPKRPIVSSSGGGGGGSGQVGTDRLTPASGDTVALSTTVARVIRLPDTPSATITFTAPAPGVTSPFWVELVRGSEAFDTYTFHWPGNFSDPFRLLAAGSGAGSIAVLVIPTTDGVDPYLQIRLLPLEGGVINGSTVESIVASLIDSGGYASLTDIDDAITALGLGTAATKNVGTSSGDVAAGNAPAVALAAAEGYTDTAVAAAIAGRVDKAPVRLVATTNLSLTGSATIDGVAVVTGNRILASGQTTGSANGIYVANTAGSWTRAIDADTSAEMVNGLAVSIQEGTDHANQLWVLTTEGTIVLGTTVLVFSALSEQVQSVFGRKGAVAGQSGDYSVAQVTGAAPLASPTFTGTPAAPTASAGTNTTQLATTAYVTAAVLANRLHPTAVKTSAYTAAAADYVRVDTTSGVVVITLPTAPADGTEIAVKRVAGATNAVTVNAGGSDTFNTTGGATSASLSLLLQAQLYNYSASDGVWIAATSNATTQLDSRYTDLTNAQTVAGVKTFSSSPIVPTPTTAFQAAPKGYIDGLRVRKRKQTDQTKNANTTLADITDMTFAIAASEEWIGRAALMVASVNSTADLDVALTVPSGATMLINAYSVRGIDALLQSYNAITSSGTRLSLQIFGAAGPTVSLVIVEFSVLNSTNAGTVALQFSQGTSNATDTTIKAGSTFYADRTA